MDLGTENVYCEELQVFFTKNSNSFLYAASTRNQRIEVFCSRLKKSHLSWWIDIFSNLIKYQFHREALIFSFTPVIHRLMILYVFETFGKLGNLQLLQAAYQKYFLMLHLQLDLTRKDTL